MLKSKTKFFVFIAILLIGVATAFSWKIEMFYPIEQYSIARILYLPSGKYMKLMSLGYPEFTADLLYLWSIQFYEDFSIIDRYQYVSNIFNTITDLNPKLVDAYRMACLIGYYEMQGDIKIIMQFTDKGITHNPKNWQIPVDGGYYAAMVHLHDISKKYFLIASKIPGAPAWTKRWVAEENYQLGYKKQAIKFWQEALETAKQQFEQQICKGHIHDITVEIKIDELKEAIEEFSIFYFRFPHSLEELVKVGLLQQIPVDPEGKPFYYDPSTGKVTPQGGFRIFHPEK